MKIYQMSEKKKRTYKAVGIFYVLVFAAVLVVKPWHYANPLYDILIYVFVYNNRNGSYQSFEHIAVRIHCAGTGDIDHRTQS